MLRKTNVKKTYMFKIQVQKQEMDVSEKRKFVVEKINTNVKKMQVSQKCRAKSAGTKTQVSKKKKTQV